MLVDPAAPGANTGPSAGNACNNSATGFRRVSIRMATWATGNGPFDATPARHVAKRAEPVTGNAKAAVIQ